MPLLFLSFLWLLHEVIIALCGHHCCGYLSLVRLLIARVVLYRSLGGYLSLVWLPIILSAIYRPVWLSLLSLFIAHVVSYHSCGYLSLVWIFIACVVIYRLCDKTTAHLRLRRCARRISKNSVLLRPIQEKGRNGLSGKLRPRQLQGVTI